MTNGEGQMANEARRMENREWRMENGWRFYKTKRPDLRFKSGLSIRHSSLVIRHSSFDTTPGKTSKSYCGWYA
jgi:hypothetical protein